MELDPKKEYVTAAPTKWKFTRSTRPYEVVERSTAPFGVLHPEGEYVLLRLDDGEVHWFQADSYVAYKEPENE